MPGLLPAKFSCPLSHTGVLESKRVDNFQLAADDFGSRWGAAVNAPLPQPPERECDAVHGAVPALRGDTCRGHGP